MSKFLSDYQSQYTNAALFASIQNAGSVLP